MSRLFTRPTASSSAVRIVPPTKEDDKPIPKPSPSKKGELNQIDSLPKLILFFRFNSTPVSKYSHLWVSLLVHAHSLTEKVQILQVSGQGLHLLPPTRKSSPIIPSFLLTFTHSATPGYPRSHVSLSHVRSLSCLLTTCPRSPIDSSVLAQSVNAPVFVPKTSTPVLSPAVTHPVEPADTSFGDEEHDPYDPFSSYSNVHDYSLDEVSSQLQAVNPFSLPPLLTLTSNSSTPPSTRKISTLATTRPI